MRFSLSVEQIAMAWRSIRGQKLRAILTVLIIGFGIMSLVGMLTAIDALGKVIEQNFASLGTNTFTIKNRSFWRMGGSDGKRYPAITFTQAKQFAERYTFPSEVSISAAAGSTMVLRHGSKKTHPKITLIGGDENYLSVAGYTLSQGRNFTRDEIQRGAPVMVIGDDILNTFFKYKEPIEQFVWVGNRRFRIVGTIASRGAGLGMGNDRMALVPLASLHNFMLTFTSPHVITVKTETTLQMHMAASEATGLFRTIRGDDVAKDESFVVEKSDGLISELMGLTSYLQLGSVVIALITLLGAMVGLLNIMLVSVTERTREIGTRKAIGATRKAIAAQFLIEAILICQIGGILGIVLGIFIGNSISLFTGGVFIVPWNWMLLAVTVCFVVGILAGWYPAKKAAALNPIEALRYE
jgi:putative ABC transport system permease protein